MSKKIGDEATIEIRYKCCNVRCIEKIRIFGDKFVQNNRSKCKIIYNNRLK